MWYLPGMKRSRTRKLLVISALAPVAVFFLTALAIVADGLTDELTPCDVGVVLGNRVEPDGRPSARLEARLDRALDLYRKGFFAEVIVSGGTGEEGFDEAAVMKRYLVERGVPPDRIRADGQGVNTLATACNASRILAGKGQTSALVVSQFYHLPRAKLAFRRAGISRVASARARFFEWRDIYATAREVVAFYDYLLFARASA